METHLSYPILGWFRSQHVDQNWLAALTTVVDACAFAIAYGHDEAIDAAELTFRIGRHALADLAYTFSPLRLQHDPAAPRERHTTERLTELRRGLQGSGLHVEDRGVSRQELEKLRLSYEPYVIAISRELALGLPDWLPKKEVQHDWRDAPRRRPGDPRLP